MSIFFRKKDVDLKGFDDGGQGFFLIVKPKNELSSAKK